MNATANDIEEALGTTLEWMRVNRVNSAQHYPGEVAATLREVAEALKKNESLDPVSYITEQLMHAKETCLDMAVTVHEAEQRKNPYGHIEQVKAAQRRAAVQYAALLPVLMRFGIELGIPEAELMENLYSAAGHSPAGRSR